MLTAPSDESLGLLLRAWLQKQANDEIADSGQKNDQQAHLSLRFPLSADEDNDEHDHGQTA